MANEIIIAQGAALTAQTEYSALIEAFISDCDGKDSSKKTYRRALRHFFGWIQATGRSIDTMQHSDIITYRNSLLNDTDYSTLTAGNYLNAVKAFYKWARNYGHYADIASGVKQPKIANKFERQPLTATQAGRLMDSVEDSGNLRDIAIISLLMNNGLRTIEVSRADIGDIKRIGDAHILSIKGKGRDSKDRFADLSDDTFNAIAAYLNTRKGAKDSEPLFVSSSNHHAATFDADGNGTGTTARLTTRTISAIAKKYLKSIGICQTEKDSRAYTAHSLRHTFGTLMILNGVDKDNVRAEMGHSSIDTTNRYVYHAEEQLRLEKHNAYIVSDIIRRSRQASL